mmetsp:Transcript_1271/g.3440  ORF Transcript_1271/g.3440 Transcript_1271/m.3440 type:complete len:239 (+) Transcript_1271:41-757(+)
MFLGILVPMVQPIMLMGNKTEGEHVQNHSSDPSSDAARRSKNEDLGNSLLPRPSFSASFVACPLPPRILEEGRRAAPSTVVPGAGAERTSIPKEFFHGSAGMLPMAAPTACASTAVTVIASDPSSLLASSSTSSSSAWPDSSSIVSRKFITLNPPPKPSRGACVEESVEMLLPIGSGGTHKPLLLFSRPEAGTGIEVGDTEDRGKSAPMIVSPPISPMLTELSWCVSSRSVASKLFFP